MSQFNPWPYAIPGPSSGGGVPQPAAPQAPPAASTVVIAHSIEIDLRTIAGDVDPPIAGTIYERDYLVLLPSDCAIQRLRISSLRNATGLSFAFRLVQLNDGGVATDLIPSTAVRQLDIAPTDYEALPEIVPDVPILMRVQSRYQLARVFVTLEALYTSAQE